MLLGIALSVRGKHEQVMHGLDCELSAEKDEKMLICVVT
jgi:hypothetical protein